MIKRLLLFALCCCFLLPGIPVQAEEPTGTCPTAWEISIQPKPTKEEIERERWSCVFANDIGIVLLP